MPGRISLSRRFKTDKIGLIAAAGKDLNNLFDTLEPLSGINGIGVRTSGANVGTQVENDKKILVRITDYQEDSEGNYFFSWESIEKLEDNSTRAITGGPFGTEDLHPLVEINNHFIPSGKVVEANWTLDNFLWCQYGGASSTTPNGDCGPGCGWVAGLRHTHCLHLTRVDVSGLCANDAPDVDKILCYDDVLEAWWEDACLVAEGGSGSGESDPWWCLSGECVQLENSPLGATGPYDTYGECAVACGIVDELGDACGTCTGDTPASWLIFVSGFGGLCGALNGDWDIPQDASDPCIYFSTMGSGDFAQIDIAATSTLSLFLDGILVATYTSTFEGDCCAPITFTVVGSPSCSSWPTTIVATPSCT